MANELIASWGPSDLRRNTSVGYDSRLSRSQVGGGSVDGIALPKSQDVEIINVVKIPGNATLTTGIKVDLVVIDDGKEPNDLGLTGVLGVTIGKLADKALLAGSGTEVKANAALEAVAGKVRIITVSVPNASLGGAAAGDTVYVRIRRAAGDVADTLFGRLLLLQATAYAY